MISPTDTAAPGTVTPSTSDIPAEERGKLIWAVGQAFTPGAPIDSSKLFAGRREQVTEILNAINQRGQHVVLFGERGVGKTSLANVLSELLRVAGVSGMASNTINCDGTDNFSSLWKKIFREIEIKGPLKKVGFSEAVPDAKMVSLEGLLPLVVTPDDVRYVLDRLTKRLVIVIDELDRITDRATTTMLADTLKNLSDHSTSCTIMLVGVADSVNDLIAEHESVERGLVQIRMPRMSLDELLEIIDKGLSQLAMTMDDEVKLDIAQLSQGLPHYTHLLCLHSCQAAITAGRRRVEHEDLGVAIGRGVTKAQQSIRATYHKATTSHRSDNLYGKVLLACALAATDDMGFFAAADVREPMQKLTGKRYDIPAFSRHLNDFCAPSKGPVLQKQGSPRRYRFRFINPLMQPFVIMHGRANGLISSEPVSSA